MMRGMNTRAAAYVRRSSVSEDSPGDVSREAQLAAVRALAEANGIDPESLQVFEDWGKSADETKKEKRTAYVALVQAIEDRNLDSVFVYHIDRIIRSVRDFTDLQRAADGHTAILTPQFPLTGTDPMARAFAQVAAVFAELELNRIKQRNKKALDVRIARGDALGHPVWGFRHVEQDGRLVREPDPDKAEDVRRVLEAVKEAGTVLGAVKLLNESKEVPPPRNGTWHTSVLTRIVKAHAPELLERKRKSGRPGGPAILAKLLRCHCGQMLTPNKRRGQYYCSRGNREGVDKHGRAHVREIDLLPWISKQARDRIDAGETADKRRTAEQRRSELEGQRERLGLALVDGLLSREMAGERAAAIDAELEQLAEDLELLDTGRPEPLLVDAEGQTFDPRRPWEWTDLSMVQGVLDPEVVQGVNADLRAMWRHVQLDQEMRPTAVEWR